MTIAYTRHGNGPEGVPVMHDWNGDHTTYDPIIPYLDGSVFNYAFVDLRGYGKSRDMTGEYTVTEVAKDCLEVADQLGWQRFHVIGHPNAELVTIPDSGHYPTQECPPYFTTVIESFLRKQAA